ncbi:MULTISPECIES: hypothetical protein [Idiomarina]|uniref:hypothetical protein n=1 Tax=Idiomarina TaxID=135575 RepID=UPI0024203391|nr:MULTISPECIES: hypothetical protein [Idiomarina]
MDKELKDLLKSLLLSTANKIDRVSFENEPNYVAGFFGKLHNETLTSSSGQFLKLTSSLSNDRGPGTAESITGIDFGMIFKWVDPDGEIVFEKAILAQAKNHLFNLSNNEKFNLQSQCQKMSKLTSSYIAMDCPYNGSLPIICRSMGYPPFWDENNRLNLSDYICDIVLECLEGDISDKVVNAARRSDRGLVIRTNSPKPKLSRQRNQSNKIKKGRWKPR